MLTKNTSNKSTPVFPPLTQSTLVPNSSNTNPSLLKRKKSLPPSPLKGQSNPFLQCNRFYLEDQELQAILAEKREEARVEAEKRKREAEEQKEKERKERDRRIAELLKQNKEDLKAGRTSWKKLGGLGANIGSEQWYQGYNKFTKMQEFADKVKQINHVKLLKNNSTGWGSKSLKLKQTQNESLNTRKRGIFYSKGIPKPSMQVVNIVEDPEVQSPMFAQQEGFTYGKLAEYDKKHQEYRQLIARQQK